jgi:hypothetical protein
VWVLVGCATPGAVLCEDGRTCPVGTACDVAHATCVRPAQLQDCAGVADGAECITEGVTGQCDQAVCMVPVCGDRFLQSPEQCDGTQVGSGNCTDVGFYDSRPLECNSSCSFDTSSCTGYCGDGIVTAGFEICEEGIAPSESCVDFGFGAGVLGCQACGPGFAACKTFDWDVLSFGTTPRDVHGLADDDVYAVFGIEGLSHFDGTSWSAVALSCVTTGDELTRVWQVAPGVVFAAGLGMVIRYDSGACTRWSLGAREVIGDMWAATPTNAYVVTNGATGVWHFDGTAWTNVLQRAGASLWGSGANDIYLVDPTGTLSHWNGTTWSAPQTISGFEFISSVWGTASNDVYIGGYDAALRAVVKHSTDGITWTSLLEDEPLLTNPYSSGIVAGYTVNNRTYVSAYRFRSGMEAFILSYDGRGWANLRAPTSNALFVWASPDGRVIIPTGTSTSVAMLRGNVRIDHQQIESGFSMNVAVRSGNDAYVTVGRGLYRWDGRDWLLAVDGANDVAIDADGRGFGVSPSGLFASSGVELDATAPGTRLTAPSGNNVWVLNDADRAVYRWLNAGPAQALSYSSLGTAITMRDIWGTEDDEVFLVGEKGVIVRWTGTAWVPMMSGTTNPLSVVWGRSATDVYAAGTGVLLHYDGTTWSEHPIPAVTVIYGVWGTAATDLFIATSEGLYHYDGVQWAPVDVGPPFAVLAVAGAGDSLFTMDSSGTPHQLVRLAPW